MGQATRETQEKLEKETLEKYPEHAKLQKISDKAKAVANFLEWAFGEKNWAFVDENDDPLDGGTNIEGLLAEHFEIDQNKLEAEKRQILDELRQ